MNLYSKKQKWKVALTIFALLVVGTSLFVSNKIVSKVGEREKERAQQWASAIKKKVELVQLTNNTFSQLRDREREKMELWIDATTEVSKITPLNMNMNYDFPLRIINENKDIPVILLDNNKKVSGNINLGFDTSDIRIAYPELNTKELQKLFNDSLLILAENWEQKNPSFSIEIYKGLFMTYFYDDTEAIKTLEAERDSLIATFNSDLINNEGLVPVLLVDSKTEKIIDHNITEYEINDSNKEEVIARLQLANKPIEIDFNNGAKNTLYFDDSAELKQLQYFPYIQFIVIGLFALIGYLIFSTFRKAEQNQVWAGMAKETAHQLGTPLSSLMAWVQLLETQGVDSSITVEMQKDVDRLEKVTDRFSKIGSGAKLDAENLGATVENIVTYLRPRISDKVDVEMNIDPYALAKHNASLIEWVVENICKNAVDAMEGVGKLQVSVIKSEDWVYIDIKDNGKGIPSNQTKTIFEPGFSTKSRGWGLGLSLVKRIVKEYHKGSVVVLESELGVGTTFRISIPAE
ncbi:MAG TPA: HAMP domain-containing histidine kinase [Crocinitomicaceae bacterium]|nr:HAMP domain-containing histidine kinase [Crocinitomicaceae bacterium]